MTCTFGVVGKYTYASTTLAPVSWHTQLQISDKYNKVIGAYVKIMVLFQTTFSDFSRQMVPTNHQRFDAGISFSSFDFISDYFLGLFPSNGTYKSSEIWCWNFLLQFWFYFRLISRTFPVNGTYKSSEIWCWNFLLQFWFYFRLLSWTFPVKWYLQIIRDLMLEFPSPVLILFQTTFLDFSRQMVPTNHQRFDAGISFSSFDFISDYFLGLFPSNGTYKLSEIWCWNFLLQFCFYFRLLSWTFPVKWYLQIIRDLKLEFPSPVLILFQTTFLDFSRQMVPTNHQRFDAGISFSSFDFISDYFLGLFPSNGTYKSSEIWCWNFLLQFWFYFRLISRTFPVNGTYKSSEIWCWNFLLQFWFYFRLLSWTFPVKWYLQIIRDLMLEFPSPVLILFQTTFLDFSRQMVPTNHQRFDAGISFSSFDFISDYFLGLFPSNGTYKLSEIWCWNFLLQFCFYFRLLSWTFPVKWYLQIIRDLMLEFPSPVLILFQTTFLDFSRQMVPTNHQRFDAGISFSSFDFISDYFLGLFPSNGTYKLSKIWCWNFLLQFWFYFRLLSWTFPVKWYLQIIRDLMLEFPSPVLILFQTTFLDFSRQMVPTNHQRFDAGISFSSFDFISDYFLGLFPSNGTYKSSEIWCWNFLLQFWFYFRLLSWTFPVKWYLQIIRDLMLEFPSPVLILFQTTFLDFSRQMVPTNHQRFDAGISFSSFDFRDT